MQMTVMLKKTKKSAGNVFLKYLPGSTIALFCYSFFIGISQADVTLVQGDSLQSLLDEGMPIIDVRRPDEWQSSGVVQDSHLLTFFDERGNYDVDKWIADLHKIVEPGEPFILICEAGIRTGSIAKFLDKKLDYEKVHDVKGGIRQWINNGRTVVDASEKNEATLTSTTDEATIATPATSGTAVETETAVATSSDQNTADD